MGDGSRKPQQGTQTALSEAVADATSIAILGCGSTLRGDDAAGSVIAERLASLESPASRLKAFPGYSAPENLTGEIKQYNPDLVLVIDAVDMGMRPGDTRLIPLEDVGGISFSTHMLPLPILMDYLHRETGCRVVLLGIQVSSLEFMAEMTPDVAQTVDDLTVELNRV